MPRQNRVTPFGTLLATPDRGTFLGNRGVLHDNSAHICRAWQVKRWITCLLGFRGRRRAVMAPGRYTELFFLDEATALAAGHCPCAECRRDCFTAFLAAWRWGNAAVLGPEMVTAKALDDRLHAERLTLDDSQRTFPANLADLPDGVFVVREGQGETAYLVWGGHLLAWSPGGYRGRESRRGGEKVRVLTPRSTVEALRAGYVPEVHTSATT